MDLAARAANILPKDSEYSIFFFYKYFFTNLRVDLFVFLKKLRRLITSCGTVDEKDMTVQEKSPFTPKTVLSHDQ